MKRKSFLSMMLAFFLVITSICVIPITETKAGETLTHGDFKYTTSTLSGKKYVEIVGYEGIKTDVVIPNTINGIKVTSVSESAFKNNTKITSIGLSDNMDSVGEDIFKGCTSLKTATLGKDTKYIEDNAFEGCSSLQEVKNTSKLKKIYTMAFWKCKSLKSFKVADSVVFIETQAFADCPAKLTMRSYMKKQKKELGGYDYVAMATVKIPRKGKDKSVSYKAANVTKIKGTKSSLTLKKKKTKKIYTKVYISKKKKSGYLQYNILKFTSSNPKVAKVTSHGNIKTLKKGKTTITVKLRTSGKSYKIKVKVK